VLARTGEYGQQFRSFDSFVTKEKGAKQLLVGGEKRVTNLAEKGGERGHIEGGEHMHTSHSRGRKKGSFVDNQFPGRERKSALGVIWMLAHGGERVVFCAMEPIEDKLEADSA